MQRTGIAAAVMGAVTLMLAGSASAQKAELELGDFQVDTTADLLDICTADPSHENFWEAQAYCLGYLRGGYDFHQALVSGPKFQPMACPTEGVTVRDAVDVFVAHARANPDRLDERPMNTVFRAVSERWPCQESMG